jgi:hypothetical protein
MATSTLVRKPAKQASQALSPLALETDQAAQDETRADGEHGVD